jgi:putative peptide modification system cyclase
MNVNAVSAPNATATPLVPALRAVLIADLADSTAMLDALGDSRAATLLQRLELHLRDLLSATHGQLIDKADGALVLFERPIQAVDFAIRYQRLLADVGTEFGVPGLRARVGIHVGEVMTWANDPRAVAAGAKPIEVEGLAKPLAARLMALALPGQVLMSGMAQSLALRAVAELGDRGERLRWIAHGRYRFKGVPAPMLVHEVGEPGAAPLRPPLSGEKGRREVPLWRRPVVLSMEVLAIFGLGFASLYGTFKSEPALAFNQRDWVVIGDLNNLTDQVRLDEPIETALRIDLAQSAYMNMVSDVRVDETLQRMGRDVDTPIDRAVGAEIAAREGARVLVLPTLTEVGGRLRISLELIDPTTQVTLDTVVADGKGLDGLLDALDQAGDGLRLALGEKASIVADSRPLEQVTTGNMDALRAFSLGLKARIEARNRDAMDLFQRAVDLDPNFAMAYLRMAFIAYGNNDSEGTRKYLDLAQANRGRLSDREALLLDAGVAVFTSPDEAMRRFRLVTELYPDEYRAHYAYGFFAHNDAQQYEAALEFMEPALSPPNAARRNAYYMLGHINLSLNRFDEALKAFKQAESLGVRGHLREYAETYAVQRQYELADRVVAQQGTTGDLNADLEMRYGEVTFAVDQGKWDDALAAVRRLEADAEQAQPLTRGTLRLMNLSLRSYLPDAGYAAELRAFTGQSRAAYDGAAMLDFRFLEFQYLASGWMSAHAGDLAAARAVVEHAGARAEASGYPANRDMARMLRAEIAIAEGKPDQAVATLEPRLREGNESYFLHAVILRAYASAGRAAEARNQADWLVSHRGLAYGEFNSLKSWQAANVLESNLALLEASQAASQLGDAAAEGKYDAAFARAWKDPSGQRVAARRRRDLGSTPGGGLEVDRAVGGLGR